MAAKEVDSLLYICDPERNPGCPKTACYLNGGPCKYSVHVEHMRIGTVPIKTKIIKEVLDEEDNENV